MAAAEIHVRWYHIILACAADRSFTPMIKTVLLGSHAMLLRENTARRCCSRCGGGGGVGMAMMLISPVKGGSALIRFGFSYFFLVDVDTVIET
jgi:hypothetical protein